MRRLSTLALLLVPLAAPAQVPEAVTLQDVLRMAQDSPRAIAAARETDAVRFEREQAGALPNPNISLSHARSSGNQTVLGAGTQEQASIDMPVPIFGQRAARVEVAEKQLGRAQSQLRMTTTEIKRAAGLAFARLLAAQEQLQVRRGAFSEVERIRSLVAGRLDSGMASRYDKARADAEVALNALALQRTEADVREQSAAIAGLLGIPGWKPTAQGTLIGLQTSLVRPQAKEGAADSPAARLARDETVAAEARIELARREQFPVPSFSLGRSWTSGPFGAANFIGLSTEIPLLDNRRALVDKARVEAAAARERERAVTASLQADIRRHEDTLAARRAALERFENDVFEQRGAFLEMAESAYRLGKGTLFELLDARRTQADAAAARVELLTAIVESEIELRALAGEL